MNFMMPLWPFWTLTGSILFHLYYIKRSDQDILQTQKKRGGGSTEESEFEQKTAFSCLAELYSFKIKTASIENVNQHLQGQASESPGIYILDNIALQLKPDSGRKKKLLFASWTSGKISHKPPPLPAKDFTAQIRRFLSHIP